MKSIVLNYLYNNRNITKLILTHIFIIIFFAIVYHVISYRDEESFSNTRKMSLFDSIYFSVIAHTTVGFGDFYPKTIESKFACMMHTLIVFLFGFMEINNFI